MQAVQARGSNIHAGPFSDVLQTLEDLYVVGAIGFVHGKRSFGSASPYEENRKKSTQLETLGLNAFHDLTCNWTKSHGVTGLQLATIALAG